MMSSGAGSTPTPGFLQNGMNFDGAANAWVSAANDPALNPTGGITISAWIYATAWTGNNRIVQKGALDDQYRLLAEDGMLAFETLTGDGQVNYLTTDLPTTNTWHWIVATHDGQRQKIYLDGASVATSGFTAPFLDITSDPLYIGTKFEDAPLGDSFNGSIDEVRIAGNALSFNWITTQYKSMTGNLLTLQAEQMLTPP